MSEMLFSGFDTDISKYRWAAPIDESKLLSTPSYQFINLFDEPFKGSTDYDL